MRVWLPLLLVLIVSYAAAQEVIGTLPAPEPEPASGINVKIVNEAQHVQKYTYEVREGEIYLTLFVQMPTPCYRVEGVESEETGENEYTVLLKVSVEGDVCIQVLPPIQGVQVRLPARDGMVVYIKETVEETTPEESEEKEEALPISTCEDLKRRIEELEKNAPEEAKELKIRYENICLDRCGRIRERIKELRESGGSEEEIKKLEEELRRCEARPLPVERAPVVEGETDPCKLAVMYKKLAEEGSEAAREAAERYEELCKEHEPEEVEEAINKAVAVGKDVREEIERIKQAIRELREQIRETQEAVRIVAKKLAESVRVEKGKIVVGGAEINVPAEIVVDENRGIALRTEGTEVVLTAKAVKVKVKAPVEVTPEGNVLSELSRRPVRVDPEEAVERARSFVEEIREILLEDDGEAPKYVVEGVDEGRLLGIIPVKIQVRAEIRADNGETIRIQRPWWAFLVFG